MEESFDAYLLELGNEVLRTLKRKGASQQDAEDAVQTAYYKIYSSLSSLDEKNLRPWFFRVAMNAYIDMARKEGHKTEAVEKLQSGFDAPHFQHYHADDSFLNLVSQVKQSYQELLILKYYYGFSEAEIAEILMTSKNNVKTTLYRARKSLAKKLGGTMDEI